MTAARLKGLFFFASLFALLSLLPLFFLPYLEITVIENARPVGVFSFLVSFVAISIAFWIALGAFSLPLFFSLALVAGGAMSNLFYRILIGPVPDYIPLPDNFFANLADVFIVLGTAVFIFFILRSIWIESSKESRESLPVILNKKDIR